MSRRILNVVAAVLGLVLASPLILAGALAIKLSSPGPVFFRAKRVGLGGRIFTMYKLRTMHLHDAGALVTSRRDKRIFTIGRLLRVLKVDELPQFLNILLGDMNVVGPRPEDPKIVAKYYDEVLARSLDFMPGLTSPGSIYYYCFQEKKINGIDPEKFYTTNILRKKLMIDIEYNKISSTWSDIFCILVTAINILTSRIGIVYFPGKYRKLLAK